MLTSTNKDQGGEERGIILISLTILNYLIVVYNVRAVIELAHIINKSLINR